MFHQSNNSTPQCQPFHPKSLGRGSAATTVTDRRRTVRHPSFGSSLKVRWRATGTVRGVRARLIDISRGGASLTAESLPAGIMMPALLIALDGPQPTGWVEAAVVEVGIAPGGLHHFRVKFSEPCPEFLEAATGRRGCARA
jgi:hypothetical protein